MSEFMSAAMEAEWTTARTPKGAIVHVKAVMANASREGRAKVAGCGPQPTEPRKSTCSISRGELPVTSPTGRRPSPEAPATGYRQSPTAARRTAERDQQQAIDRYRPFIQVATVSTSPRIAEETKIGAKAHFRPSLQIAAVRATQPEPRPPSPDHYGLGRHIREDRRHLSPVKDSRWPASYEGAR